MDIGIILSIAALVLWAVATFAIGDVPGYVHLLLTLGLALLFWRISRRNSTRTPPA